MSVTQIGDWRLETGVSCFVQVAARFSDESHWPNEQGRMLNILADAGNEAIDIPT